MLKKLLASWMLVAMLASSVCLAFNDSESLRSIENMFVLVEDMPPTLNNRVTSDMRIKTIIELRLRQFGVPFQSNQKRASSYLYVQISGGFTDAPAPMDIVCSLSIVVSSYQHVTLDSGRQILACTWTQSGCGTVFADYTAALERAVLSHVDMFINDYLSVNPRQAPPSPPQPNQKKQPAELMLPMRED